MVLRLLPQTRCGSLRRRCRPATLVLALASAFGGPSGQAQSLPVGGVAVHGQAAISTPAPNQLRVVTHNGAGTNHSAINWQSFSVSPGSSATFVQPSAASVSINRVVTNTPSALFGNLSSNGRLVLVNPSGIAVGAGAVIDTAGFTASALRMGDADALAGRLRFGDANASMGGASGITVGGRITARQGDVVLVAPNIDIGGSALLQAPNGSTILAAGQQVEITGRGLEGITLVVQAPADQVRNLGRLEGNAAGIFAGTLRHSGEIRATTATLDGGVVVLRASGDAIVEGSGKVLATGGRGGQVDVLGQRVAVTDQALIDVSGAQGGGTIRVGGDYRGRNPDVPNADTTFVGAQATLKADATGQGAGGRVIVWSDDATVVEGAISARGGSQGGSAGFVETSGKRGLFVAQAPSLGAGGLWLLDPTDLELGSVSGTLGYDGFTDVATIISALQAGTPVLATATNRIDLTDQIIAVAAPGAGLTFTAGGTLTVQGSGGLIVSGSPMLTTMTAGGQIDLQAFAPVNLGTGTLSMTAGTGITQAATSTITAAGVTVNTTSGSASLVGTGNNLQVLDLTGAANVVNSAALTVASVNSFNKSVSINAGGSTITLPGTPIDLGSGDLSLVGVLSVPANLAAHDISLTGNATMGITGDLAATGNVTLAAAADITLAGAVNASGNFSTTTSNPGGTVLVTNVVNAAGSVTMNVAGTLQVDATAGAPAQLAAGADQVINALGLSLVAGSIASSSSASMTSGGNQSLTIGAGGVALTGGSGGASNSAIVNSVGNQTITAPGITLTGGSGGGGMGTGNKAQLAATGNQYITVGSGGINLSGGGGALTDNQAHIYQSGGVGTSQEVTINGGGNLVFEGGSSALPNVGGLGHGSFAALEAYGDSQIVNFTSGGSIQLTGGINGSRARALIYGDKVQTVSGATTITITGGASGGVDTEGNDAFIGAGNQQTVNAVNIVLQGGENGFDNVARLSNGTGNQAITASSGITLTGGADGGGLNLGNAARITASGNQAVTVGSGGLHLTGGGGALTDNSAELTQSAIPGSSQSITVNGGGSITLQGGTSGIAGVGSGHGSRAQIGTDNGIQTISFASGGQLHLTGGNGGSRNYAQIYNTNGPSQAITGSDAITITGGATGGINGEGNYASINASLGNQTISVGSGGISISGGSGGLTTRDNYGEIFQGGLAGTSQIVTVGAGGDITLQGGSSTALNVGLGNGSVAIINANGDTQLIEFAGPGRAINLTGGTIGSNNNAGILSNFGAQTIRGSVPANAPTITLTGGSGGAVGAGNGAFISADNGLQTVSSKSLTLNGGSGTESYALLTGPTQSLVVDGNVTLSGGTGMATGGVRVGGRSTSPGSNTNLTMAVSGNLTVTGVSAAGAAISATSAFPGLTNDINITAGGNVTLSPGALSPVRIGSTATDIQAGTIAINAASIAMNPGDGASNVVGIRTLGNVTLTATTANITEAADGAIRANQLTASAVTGIDLAGNGNQVTTLSATNLTSGAVTFTNAPGALLTVSGISQAGGNVVISADDLNLSGAVGAGAGTVTLRPTTLSRNTVIESSPTAGVLSLSTAELQLVSAAALEVGRLDGTGDLAVNQFFLDAEVNVGTMRFLAGNSFNHGGLSGIGAGAGAFNVELRANNNVNLLNSNVNVGDNRNLTVVADNDVSGVGDVNIGAVTLQVGSGVGNSTGNMAINGRNIAVTTSGSGTGLVQVTGSGTQGLTAANNITLTNSSTTSGTLKILSSDSGAQSVTAGGLLSMVAGTGTGTSVELIGNGNQTVVAHGIALTGGASGGGSNTGNSALLTAAGIQDITVGSGGISLTGGGGLLSDNQAFIYQSGTTGTSQLVTVNGGGSIVAVGGSSAAPNVGGLGHGSFAGIQSRGDTQTIQFSSGGAINLTGGTIGSRAYGFIFADNGAQSITGGPNITLKGGDSGGVDTEGNEAFISTGVGSQNIVAGTIVVQGGAGGAENVAGLRGTGGQTLSATGITLTGGAGGGGLNTGNRANVETSGNQNITVGSGGLHLAGGGGVLTDNSAQVAHIGIAGTSQNITVNGGGSITVQGGTSGIAGVGTNHGSRAQIGTDNGTQTITFTAGGQLHLIGGDGGSRNYASIYNISGPSQTITGPSAITVTGGATGGIAGEGNYAAISASAGNQTISVGSGGISISGGSGGLTDLDNYGLFFQGGLTGTSQVVTIGGGGNITLQGGSSTALNVGANNGSSSYISANGDSQLIEFTGAGSAISIVGGTAGSNNNAGIFAANGSQTIRGSVLPNAPAISIIGGAGGGFAGEGNYGGVFANVGPQSITASAITLQGGSGGVQTSAAISAPTQTLVVTGNVNLIGGNNSDSDSGSRIGGRGGSGGSTNTDLNLQVGGNLTLTAGSSSSVGIGATPSVTGLTNAIAITAGGNVALNPSATKSAGIGSLGSAVEAGSVAIAAGGDIVLNSGGGVGFAAVRSLGNVNLSANNAGKFITQAANSVIVADVLTTSSGAGTSLLGTNQVNSFNATSGTAGISLVNNQSLVLGAVSAGTGTQAVNISTVGGSSNLTVGALSGDDNISLSAGGELVLTGALSGNSLSLTSGAQLELNHDITASGGLTLATTNGGNITQFTGAITVAGTTVASAGAGDITLANVANDFNQFSATGGIVLVHDVNGVALGASTVQSLALEAGGALALNGAVNASGAGDAVSLSSSSGAFDATGGSITTLNGRWLLYLAAPAGSNFGALAPAFVQYGATLGSTVVDSGSAVLFALSPTISASLGTGVHASKVYDGGTTLDLSDISILVTATGVQPGDMVTLGKVGLGVLDDPNVGLGKNVTQAVQITNTTSGGVPAYGYTFLATGTTSSAASALIGDVTAATLTIGGVSASSRAYDGTTVASLAGSASVTPLGSDSVSVIGSGVGSFSDKHVGTGKPVTVSGFTLSGPSAGNYLPLQPSGLTADITTANLTLTTSAVAKGYDGTTTAVGTAIVGSGTLFAGDTLSGGAFAYLDKHAGTGKSVTVGGVTVNDGNGGGNYFVTYADNTTSSISAAPLTVSAGAVSKTYDGTTSAAGVPTVTSGTLFAGDTFSGGSFAFLDKNVGTNKTVTVSGVNIVDGNAGGNYSLTLVDNTTSTITQANLAIGGIGAANRVYDGGTVASLTGSASVTPFGSDIVTVVGAGVGSFADKHVGTGKPVTVSGFTLSGTDGANYLPVQPSGVVADVTAATLTLTTGAVARGYDGTTVAAGTAVVSNGTLFSGDTLAGGTFAYQDKHVGTGKTVSVSGVTVNDGNGGANYNVGYADNTASSISAAPLTVSAAAVTKTYDGTTSAAGVPSVSSGTLFAGDAFSGGSFAFLDKDAGTNKTVTVAGVSIVDGNGGGNYVVSFVDNFTSTINPAGLAIGGIAATSRVYDGSTAASLTGSAVVTPFGSDTVSVIGTGVGSFADKHAGSGKPVNVTGFTLTGADAGNYLPLQPNPVASITPANLTLTTQAASRVYDGTTVAPGAAIVSNGTLFAGDTLTGGNFAYLDKHAGTGKTVTVGGVTVNDGNGGGNYAVSYVDNTSSSIVPAALTVSAAAVTKTYDGTTSAVGTPAVSSGTLFEGDTLSGGGFAFLDKNAGTNKTVTASGVTISDGNGGGNYVVTFADNTTSTITPASLVVSTGAVSKVYDGMTSATGTAVVNSGVLFGSDTLSGGSFAYLDKNAGTGKSVAVSAVAVNDGNGGANYALSFVNNTASSITPANLSVTTNAVSKVYDGTTVAPGLAVVSGGTLFADDTLAGGNFAYLDKHAGTGKTVAVSGVTVNDGNGGGNYTITYTDNTASSISAAPLTVSAGAVSKTYDGNTSAVGSPVVSSGTLFAGDTLSGGGFVFADKNVGTNKVVSASGVVVDDGNGGANYNLSFTGSLTGSISPLASVGWTGSAGDNLWSSAGNWAGGAIPDGANVVAVTINTGSGPVNHDVPGVNIQSLTSTRPVNQGGGGSFTTGALTLSTTQGITLDNPANQIATLGATNNGGGDITIRNTGALNVTGLVNTGGNITLTNTGAVVTSGPVSAMAVNITPPASVAITANSPLTIGSAGVQAAGDITLTATNLTSAGNMVLNGPVVAGNQVKLSQGGTLEQNSAVVGNNGVRAVADTGPIVFGSQATANGSTIAYSAAGVAVPPPPTELVSKEEVVQTANVVSFLDRFEAALTAQRTTEPFQTNPDGSKKKKATEDTIVTEGEICR